MSTKQFSADVAQLIHLVTHSIYSNPDIFLRELISNASDALAKAEFASRTDSDYLGDQTDLSITLDVDEKAHTITLTDNGVGMTETEVIENIGTIAKSGTKAFVEALNKSKESTNDLIGQFGIGFYSVFMVADQVILETKTHNADAIRRSSTGTGEYDIATSDKRDRGTTITIHLQEAHHEYANAFKLKSLIRKHSNYVPYPIMMLENSTEENKTPTTYEQVNKAVAIRSKRSNEVTDEEYQEYYSSISFDQEKTLDHLHLHVEGKINYQALLYIPQKHNPLAAMMGANQEEYGPSLYVQNVLIMENAKELLPPRLRFIKGVVQTPDLPLNVSREILQNNALMALIQKSLVKKILESLQYQLTENIDNYTEFYTNYGKTLKEWIHFSFDHKEQIAGLWLRHSFKHNKHITLDEYKADLNKEDKIYYLTGSHLDQLTTSPYLEKFKQSDHDVILMSDPIDDRVVQSLTTYQDHELQDAKHADITTDDTPESKKQKKQQDKINQDNKNFIAYTKQTIGTDKLDTVSLVNNLTDSVAVLIPKEWAPSAQQERYMKAMGQNVPTSVQDLHLNSDHPLVQKVIASYETDPKDETVTRYLQYFYDQALLLQGREVENMAAFIQTTNQLLQQ